MIKRAVQKLKRKKEVLVYGDYLAQTGFSTVVTNIVNGLNKKFDGDVHFHILAINWWGDQLEDDYKIKSKEVAEVKVVDRVVDGEIKKVKVRIRKFIGKNITVYSAYHHDGKHDELGRNAFLSFANHNNYDLLFIVNDPGAMAGPFEILKEIKKRRKEEKLRQFKVLYYMPMDCEGGATWFKDFDVVDRLIVYTEYAKHQVLKVAPHLKMRVVLHGINVNVFKRIEDRQQVREFRESFFVKNADKIIFCNINRNQSRKDIPTTIFAFDELKKIIPNIKVFLYLHMDPQDIMGWNLPMVLSQTKLIEGEDYMFKPDDDIEPDYLNCIYNACDIYVTSTLGEGFGLTILEAMAAGIPVIAPAHTSIKEIGKFVEEIYRNFEDDDERVVFYRTPLIKEVLTVDNTVRYKMDATYLAQIMFSVYNRIRDGEPRLFTVTDAAANYAKSLSWSTIVPVWYQEIKALL